MERHPRLVAAVLAGVLSIAASAAAMDRLHYQEYPELEGLTVRQIVILGNNHTKELVFRREIRLTEGAEFRSEVLWRDWERLVDLGLFANIEVDAVPSEDGVLVVISVYERPRWFAAPLLDYDLDTGDIRYGYTLRFRNLNGLNRSLSNRATAGDKNRFRLSYSTPWLGSRRQELGASINLEFPQTDVDELLSNRITVATTWFVGDYLVVRQGITGFGGLERLKREETHPDGGVDEIAPSIGARWFRDTRNVRVDPARGTLLQAALEYNYGLRGEDDLEYVRGAVDARGFRKLGWLTIATRLNTIISKGRVPDYRRVAVGGAGSIRGQPSEVDVGQSTATVAAELRFPLLPQRRFSIPIPGLPRQISNFDLRVDGAVFVDTGTAWEDREDLANTSFKTGGGFGLRIFLPVLELARLELAVDRNGTTTFYFREGNII
jgi:outer membrane protein assembly factor BamA